MNRVPEPPEPLPPEPLPPVQEDLLGRRSSAALIDIALLAGVFLIFSLTVGDAGLGGGKVYAYLNGTWFLVYLAVVLVYYFALEASLGQTVGKRLLGLRVVRADGSRPSVAAIAVRTLLRIVDWLPALYLVGFLAMATSVRRRRLGDLVAKTSVARALPVRHRGLALVPVALVAVLLAVSAYHASVTGNEAKTYQGHGVSFEYPAGWQEASKVHQVAASGGGNELWGTGVAVGTGTNVVNAVIVSAYRLSTPVTAENLADAKAAVTTAVRQLLEQLGGAVQSGPEELTMGGLSGFRFRGTGTHEGTPIESTLVFAFDGTTEYFLNCQHTKAHAVEVERGCDQIVRTFKVTAPGSAASAATASTATAPRPGNKIVFTSNRTGTYNIYLVNADGSGLRQLTQFQIGEVARPSLSPDGITILFQRQDKPAATSDIWGVQADGSRMRSLTPEPDDEGSPTWSPDGTKVAFASNRSSASDIFLMNPDGSGIKQLTHNSAIEDDPVFSPDGKQLAFLKEGSIADPPVLQLWTMNADGTGARQLTKTPVEIERPAWSPDGNKIAFTRSHGGNTDVFVIDADGGQEQLLIGGPADDYQPTWSPDGKTIAFGSNRDGPPSLYLLHTDGGRISRLTRPGKGQDEDLSWQP
jgi:Tol biopolymer transport system component/uncharacterized RDD family membrane protein YckC